MVQQMDAVEDTFGVTLVPGLASGADSDGVVELSLAGAGEVVYKVVEDTDAELKDEWVALTVMFEWESADLMPAERHGYRDRELQSREYHGRRHFGRRRLYAGFATAAFRCKQQHPKCSLTSVFAPRRCCSRS